MSQRGQYPGQGGGKRHQEHYSQKPQDIGEGNRGIDLLDSTSKKDQKGAWEQATICTCTGLMESAVGGEGQVGLRGGGGYPEGEGGAGAH